MKTIVVQLTGHGRGAIASLLVDGPSASQLTQNRFRSMSSTMQGSNQPDWELNKPYFGIWTWNEYSEELVICRTGEHRIEIHCHGGRLAARQIIQSLIDGGAVELDHAGWLERSTTDQLAAHAIELLSKATTERTASIVMDQVRGAMRRELSKISDWLRDSKVDSALLSIARLVQLGKLGTRIHRPFSVVLLGPPNTGKSSLINAIVGYQRSIVFDQPGTTRDLVRVETAIDGWPIQLTDTAGVRKSGDPVEQQGIQLARQTLETADLVLVVMDLSTSSATDAFDLADSVKAPSLFVGTKADLSCDFHSAHQGGKRLPHVATSATTGRGIEALTSLLAARIAEHVPEPGEAVPLSQSTMEALMEVELQLRSGGENLLKIAAVKNMIDRLLTQCC